MSKSYTLGPDEKSTQIMVGTHDMLLWGDLITKGQIRMSAFLTTVAEEFVPIREAKILFLAPGQQVAPVERSAVYVRLEEILLFYSLPDSEPPPQETEVRRLEPVEALVGSFQVEGLLLKSPVATIQNMLLVAKDAYLPIYRATVRHVAKPWLGTLTSSTVQVRRDRLTLTTQ
jgi:hypothetical protein